MLLVSLPSAAVRCLGSIGKLVCSLRRTDGSPQPTNKRTYGGGVSTPKSYVWLLLELGC